MAGKSATVDWETAKCEWLSVLRELADDIKLWAEQQNWPVHEEPKEVHEEHLGTYEVPYLQVRLPETTLIIDPIARQVGGAEGRVDLEAFPSLHRFLLLRHEGHWRLTTDSGVQWPNPWGRDAFVDLARRLAGTS